MNPLIYYTSTISAFLIALTFHEFCHALMACALGDDTAKRLGRLTLNPLSHIDLLGLFFLILVGIGWAKPVPFNPENFKRPKLYSVLVGLAGPFSNLVLALFFLYAIRYTPSFGQILLPFFKTSVWINVMLAIFNLVPIPPLDGSHLIAVQIPPNWRPAYLKFQQFGFIILIILLSIPAVQKAFFYSIMITIELLSRLVL